MQHYRLKLVRDSQTQAGKFKKGRKIKYTWSEDEFSGTVTPVQGMFKSSISLGRILRVLPFPPHVPSFCLPYVISLQPLLASSLRCVVIAC
jgi:hypothetical protein